MNPFATIPFPGQAISPNPPQSVQLRSGAVYNFPEGNFLVKPGAQTAIQWKDYYSGQWRVLQATATGEPIFVPSDGTNYRAINLSGTVSGATITTPGTLYTQAGTTVSFAAPVAGGVTAAATPIIGGALTLAIPAGGSGYTNPQIFIDPPQLGGGVPGLCIPATAAVTTLTAGVLTAVTLGYSGAGYAGVPNVSVTDPTGTGAVITASIANGTAASGGLTGLVMTNNGALYDGTHIPAVTIACAGSSGTAAATALPCLSLTGVTVGGTNTGYADSVIGITSLGAVSTPPKAVFGDPIHARPGRVTIPQSGGVLGAASIEDAGIGFQTVPLLRGLVDTTGSNATFVSVVGGVTNTLIFWPL